MSKKDKAKAAAKLRRQKAQLLLMQSLAGQRINDGLTKSGRGRLTNPYKHLINYIGKPNSLIPLIGNPVDVSSFVYATPAQLGNLVPMMEFYYSEGKSTDKGKKVPDQKILFSDYIQMSDRVVSQGGKSVRLAGASAMKDDTSMLLKGRGTLGTGVGVKDFSWQFDNKHEGDKTLKASITLFFASVRELLNEEFTKFLFVTNPTDLQSPKPASTTAESTDGTRDMKQEAADKEAAEEIAWALANAYELMGGKVNGKKSDSQHGGRISSKKRTASGTGEVLFAAKVPDPRDPREFTVLKARVGWATPRGRASNLEGPFALNQKFLTAVEGTQKVIALNLISYKLNFKQEGQVELKIEYVGSLDSILASSYISNVLADSDNKEPISKKRIYISKTMEDINWGFDKAYEDYVYSGAGPIPNAGKTGVNFTYQKRLRGGRGTSHVVTVPHQVRGILAKRIADAAGDQFMVSLDEVDFELAILNKHKDYVDRFDKNNANVKKALEKGIAAAQSAKSNIQAKIRHDKYAKFMTNLYTNSKLHYVQVDTKDLMTSDKEGTKTRKPRTVGKVNAGGATTAQQQAAGKRMQGALKAEAQKQRNPKAKPPTGGVLDPLGNIADSPDAGEDRTKVNLFYFKLGDIIEEALTGMHGVIGMQPRIVLGSFAPSVYDVPGTKGTDIYPLCDLPISVDYFGQWFLQTFVQSEPPVDAISFRRFLDSLLNDLVAPLINDAYAIEGRKKLSFSLASAVSSLDFAKGRIIDGTDVEDAAKNQGTGNGHPSMAQHNYFIIFIEQATPDLNESITEDLTNGIYHFTLGSDRGLVKTFSFSEKKMPQLRALNIENSQQGSALILPQDLELTMVGNTLFRNGQLLYINADLTLGSAVASKLGLGGYYMVVKSNNTISTGKFETTLTCMWQKRPGKD